MLSSLAHASDTAADDRGTDVITFAKGLPGFEACRRFVLRATDNSALQCLSSVEGPDASFLAVDPRRVLEGYRCQLTDADRLALGVGQDEDEALLWLALLMAEPNGEVTVNLRAPVVINPRTMQGQQVIPFQCIDPLRHPLLPAE
jgi:flagellar assembly factor FliW